LLSEDEWLATLYPNKISSLKDYVEYSNLLKPQTKKLVQSILSTGTDVVMDFPANTLSQRDWFRSVFSEIDAPHNLIYLELPNEVCLKQIEKRRTELPERAATDTPEMFEKVSEQTAKKACCLKMTLETLFPCLVQMTALSPPVSRQHQCR